MLKIVKAIGSEFALTEASALYTLASDRCILHSFTKLTFDLLICFLTHMRCY